MEPETFDVLGYKVKIGPAGVDAGANDVPEPQDVVDKVQSLANEIKELSTHLSSGEIATLVALKLAGENIRLEQKIQKEVSKIRDQAKEATDVLDQVLSHPQLN